MTSDLTFRLKAWRAERGVSQSALARYLGVTRQAVNNWETGAYNLAHPRMLAYSLRYYDIEHGGDLTEVAARLRKIADQIDERAA